MEGVRWEMGVRSQGMECERVRSDFALQVFGETVGRLPGSYLAQERGFEVREREFRREMDALHSNTHSELTIQVCPHIIPPAASHDVSCPRWNGLGTSCCWE